MLKIGDFSKLSRISIRMLRHYDEIGLLKPECVDNFTGYRYYKAGQLSQSGRILLLKNMGFSLAAITEIIHQYGDAEALRNYLRIKYAEVKQEAAEAEERLRLLESTINRLGKDEFVMKYDVNVKEMPRRNVASVREVIPNYESEGMLWGKLREEIEPQNVVYENPCYTAAVFHDQSFKESDVDVEVQIAVSGKYRDTQNVRFKTIEPVLTASVTYQGGYDKLNEVNEAIGNWLAESDYEFDGAMFNIYHVSPAMEQNPDNWVTEVCYPVKKK